MALLTSVLAGTLLSNLSLANPFEYAGEVPPKPDTLPPRISVDAPRNNSIYYTNFVALTSTVTGPTGPTVYSSYVENISCKPDWQNNITLYTRKEWAPYGGRNITQYTVDQNFTGLAEGKHSVTLFVTYHGTYIPGNIPGQPLSANGFTISGSSVVYFIVDDRIQPEILTISLENKTFDSIDVPLNFRVNGSISQITYSLDGKMNVSIAGNTTLTGLSYGSHYLTAYPTDAVGHSGMPKIVKFTIIDIVPPKISILSIEKNRTYNSSNLALNFTVNEALSKLSYVLDGQPNATLVDNETLTGLSNGKHNVTVYATDIAGNIGASETLYFTVNVPQTFLSIVPFTVASAVVAIVVVAGLLAYRKKRRRSQN